MYIMDIVNVIGNISTGGVARLSKDVEINSAILNYLK